MKTVWLNSPALLERRGRSRRSRGRRRRATRACSGSAARCSSCRRAGQRGRSLDRRRLVGDVLLVVVRRLVGTANRSKRCSSIGSGTGPEAQRVSRPVEPCGARSSRPACEERVLLARQALGPAGREVVGHLRRRGRCRRSRSGGPCRSSTPSSCSSGASRAAVNQRSQPGATAAGPSLALLVGVEELADVGGVVAGVLQPGRQHVLLLLQVGVEVAQDAVVVAVLSRSCSVARDGQQSGRRDDVVGEGGASRHQVRVRFGIASGMTVFGRLIVGHDQDDVRACFSLLARPSAGFLPPCAVAVLAPALRRGAAGEQRGEQDRREGAIRRSAL